MVKNFLNNKVYCLEGKNYKIFFKIENKFQIRREIYYGFS